jgi:hypothetical protein
MDGGASVRCWLDLDVVRVHVHADLQVPTPKLETPLTGYMIWYSGARMACMHKINQHELEFLPG